MYFLYTHTRLDKNEIFYVGIGTVPKESRVWDKRTKYARAFVREKRTTFWKNIAYKTEVKVDIILESEDRSLIISEEKRLICLYGKLCDNTGTLVNFTSGGDVGGGLINRNIAVRQLDLNGKEIKIWEQLKNLQNELGFLKTNIVKCCRGKQLTAYGYKWEYVKNNDFKTIYPLSARKPGTRCREITVTNMEGVSLGKFRTMNQAAQALGIDRSTVFHGIHKKRNSKDYIFSRKTG